MTLYDLYDPVATLKYYSNKVYLLGKIVLYTYTPKRLTSLAESGPGNFGQPWPRLDLDPGRSILTNKH